MKTFGLTLHNDEVLMIPASFYHYFLQYQRSTVAQDRKFHHQIGLLLYSDIATFLIQWILVIIIKSLLASVFNNILITSNGEAVYE